MHMVENPPRLCIHGTREIKHEKALKGKLAIWVTGDYGVMQGSLGHVVGIWKRHHALMIPMQFPKEGIEELHIVSDCAQLHGEVLENSEYVL